MSLSLLDKVESFGKRGGVRTRLILKSQEIAKEYKGVLAPPSVSEESLSKNVARPSGTELDFSDKWGMFKNDLFDSWKDRFEDKFGLFNDDFFDKKKIIIPDPTPQPDPDPSPVISKITSQMVSAAIGYKRVDHWLLEDQEYSPADVNLLVAQMRVFKISSFEYRFPGFDCGNFSFAAKGVWNLDYELAKMATFIVWVSFPKNGTTYIHALNGCVTKDRRFYFIDPQNNNVYTIPNNYKFLVVLG
jgi:hypothetical protein